MTDLSDFILSEEWTNYGDVNPKPHGGRFVRWDDASGHWEMVMTTRDHGLTDMDGKTYMFEHHVIYPDDVFVDGDPENGLTIAMKGILSSLGEENYDPDMYPDEPFGYAPEFMENLQYYLVDIPWEARFESKYEFSDEYWGYLERFDISPDDA